MSKYKVGNVNKVYCPYCGKEFNSFVHWGHLSKIHGKKIEDVNIEFPDHITMTKKYNQKVKEKANSKNRIEKMKQTCKERYGGVGFSGQSGAKSIKTIKEKYGADNAMKCKEISKKFVGDNNPMKNKNVSEKISKSLKGKPSKFKNKNYNEIFGEEKAKEITRKRSNTLINKFLPDFELLTNYFDVTLIDKEYKGAHIKHRWKCNKCNQVFEQIWNSIQQGYLCPTCFPRCMGFSKAENDIGEFLRSLEMNIIQKCKTIIPPKEIDIYIPSKNIAIEFNGLYWHNEEKGVNKNYHLNKTIECEEKGIRLIHIFEDEWIFKQNILKNRLKQILGISDSERIHARQCEIKEIESSVKNKFLDKYHIQGCDNSTIKLGAFYKDELISVMTFSKGNISKGSKSEVDIWELNRFCSNYNYHIPGIASKLLEYFKRNYKWKKIFSYADRRWSNGNLYNKLGFNFESETPINYWYIKDGRRFHRFGLRKRHDEPKDIPEWVLRQKEGYTRIWDCGNLKFVLENI